MGVCRITRSFSLSEIEITGVLTVRPRFQHRALFIVIQGCVTAIEKHVGFYFNVVMSAISSKKCFGTNPDFKRILINLFAT